MGRLINAIPKTFFGGSGRKIESANDNEIKETPYKNGGVKTRRSIIQDRNTTPNTTTSLKKQGNRKQSTNNQKSKLKNGIIPDDIARDI